MTKTKWARSKIFSERKSPVYFTVNPFERYGLTKVLDPIPHWVLFEKAWDKHGVIYWNYLEHFLSNITFNDVKRWFENSKYNTNNKEV